MIEAYEKKLKVAGLNVGLVGNTTADNNARRASVMKKAHEI